MKTTFNKFAPNLAKESAPKDMRGECQVINFYTPPSQHVLLIDDERVDAIEEVRDGKQTTLNFIYQGDFVDEGVPATKKLEYALYKRVK